MLTGCSVALAVKHGHSSFCFIRSQTHPLVAARPAEVVVDLIPIRFADQLCGRRFRRLFLRQAYRSPQHFSLRASAAQPALRGAGWGRCPRPCAVLRWQGVAHGGAVPPSCPRRQHSLAQRSSHGGYERRRRGRCAASSSYQASTHGTGTDSLLATPRCRGVDILAGVVDDQTHWPGAF